MAVEIERLDMAGVLAMYQGMKAGTLTEEQETRLLARFGQLQDAERRAEQWQAERAAKKAATRLAKVPKHEQDAFDRVVASGVFSYETIQARRDYLEKAQGKGTLGSKAPDYLVMSEDPYIEGRPAEWKAAKWIHDIWPIIYHGNALWIRAYHYAARIAGGIVTWPKDPNKATKNPGGLPYDAAHSDLAWGDMMEACKHGRYLGTIPPDAFVDAKNPPMRDSWVVKDKPETDVAVAKPKQPLERPDPEPLNRAMVRERTLFRLLGLAPSLRDLEGLATLRYPQRLLRPGDTLSSWDLGEHVAGAELPHDPLNDDHLPDYHIEKFRAAQRYHLFVLCEKAGPTATLEQWCRRHNARLLTFEGEGSITAPVEIVKTIFDDGRPAVILYVSDHDMVGQQMPVSVGRKLQFWREFWEAYKGLARGEGPEIILAQVALTAKQVKDFGFLQEPIKDSMKYIYDDDGKLTYDANGQPRETWRWRKWKWQHYPDPDPGSVELDALEAIEDATYGTKLGRVLHDAVNSAQFYDTGLKQTERDTRKALQAALDERRAEALDEHDDELAEARVGWTEAIDGVETRWADETDAAVRERDALWDAVRSSVEEPIAEADRVIGAVQQQTMREIVVPAHQEAMAILEPAYRQAMAVLERAYGRALHERMVPAYRRAGKLTRKPIANGERKLKRWAERRYARLDRVRQDAYTHLDDAWKPLAEMPDAIKTALEEKLPDFEDDDKDLAAPIGAEASADVMDGALFWSKRPYMETVKRFKVYQGLLDPDDADEMARWDAFIELMHPAADNVADDAS